MSNDRKYRDIYVMSDIHGDKDGYLSVLTDMYEDGFDHRGKDLLVFLGDLVDGFPHSNFVVQYVRSLCRTWPNNVICLKGNHEELMIHGVDSVVGSDQFQIWWTQGGAETWKSYWDTHEEVYRTYPYLNISPKMHEHIEWFKTLPTLFETEDYYFVHAGLDPEREPHDTSIFSRLWIRGPFLRSERMWDKMVVHGHSPMKEPEIKSNRINVNTRPRGEGYVTGARLSNDGTKQVVKFYHGPKTARK